MSAEPPPSPPPAASPLDDLQRLFRRISLLRAGRHHADVHRLEADELPRALDAVRSHGDAARIAPLLAAEEARVAEAQALAELLAPILAGQLSLTLTAPVSAEAAPRTARAAAPAPRSGLPTIADFIDTMIAQEHPVRASTLPASAPSRSQPAIHRSP